MGFLRRHKPEPIDMTPPGPPDRTSQRLAELAGELQHLDREAREHLASLRKADLQRQLDRVGVNVWAGFLREERTVCLPTVQPPGVARDQPAG